VFHHQLIELIPKTDPLLVPEKGSLVSSVHVIASGEVAINDVELPDTPATQRLVPADHIIEYTDALENEEGIVEVVHVKPLFVEYSIHPPTKLFLPTATHLF
jgi:hypothetical protein